MSRNKNIKINKILGVLAIICLFSCSSFPKEFVYSRQMTEEQLKGSTRIVTIHYKYESFKGVNELKSYFVEEITIFEGGYFTQTNVTRDEKLQESIQRDVKEFRENLNNKNIYEQK